MTDMWLGVMLSSDASLADIVYGGGGGGGEGGSEGGRELDVGGCLCAVCCDVALLAGCVLP